MFHDRLGAWLAQEGSRELLIAGGLTLGLLLSLGLILWARHRLHRLADEHSGPMGLLDHLREARFRIVTVLASVGALSVLLLSIEVRWTGATWNSVPYPVPTIFDSVSAKLVRLLLDHVLRDDIVQVSVLSPYEAATTLLIASLIGGVVLAAPIIAYQVLAFILPALTERERRIGLTVLAPAIALFLLGAGFALWLVVPVSLTFLYAFSGALGATAIARPVDVLKFTLMVLVLMGLAFQSPLVMGVLSRLGMVQPGTMARGWRVMLVVSLVLGGLMPDPSVVTQLLVAGPLFLLYLVGIGVAYAVRPKRDGAVD